MHELNLEKQSMFSKAPKVGWIVWIVIFERNKIFLFELIKIIIAFLHKKICNQTIPYVINASCETSKMHRAMNKYA